MRVLIFGATGMVGQGVLRECLLDPDVELVQTIGRTATGESHPKLRDVVYQDLWNYSSIEDQLRGFDACFFCLGVASAGQTEEAYTRVTYGISVAAGEILSRLNPQMTFIFVSGAGADSSEKGSVMWTRVKGKAENALLRMPFKAVYVFRPGIIEPMFGAKSKTAAYRVFYTLAKPLMPVFHWMIPNQIMTTQQIGLAMLALTKKSSSQRIFGSKEIRALLS